MISQSMEKERAIKFQFDLRHRRYRVLQDLRAGADQQIVVVHPGEHVGHIR